MLEQRVCPFTARKTLVGDKILESDLHAVHRHIGEDQEIQKCRQNKKIQHLIALHQNPVYIFTGGRPPPGHPQLNFPACLYFSLHELGRSSFACAAQPLCRRGRSRFSYIREPLNKSPSFSAERENRRLPLGSSDSVGK